MNAAFDGKRTAANRTNLARFLRARREALSPREAGIEGHGRRRTPGLRREEVAAIAEIGTAWYARLEMGHDVNPSPATMLAIARALRLSVVETEYLFALAAIPVPALGARASSTPIVPEAIEQMMLSIGDVGAVLWDQYMTALRWNAIADAMFGYSQCATPIERNSIVRFFRDSRRSDYYGSDTVPLLRSLIGIFRKAYVVGTPSQLATDVYEAVREFPLFEKLWNEQIVSEDLFDARNGPFQRNHPAIGSFWISVSNLRVSRCDDLILRIIVPAEPRYAAHFSKLSLMGTASQRPSGV